MVPRCEVCGLEFLASDSVVICGMTKAHAECRSGGRPPPNGAPRVSPRELIRSSPNLLTLKLQLADGGKTVTFFFLRTDSTKASKAKAAKEARMGPAHASYTPDDAPHAPKSRPLPSPLDGATVAIAGDLELGRAPVSIASDGSVVAELRATKMSLAHRMVITFRLNDQDQALEAGSLELAISVPC